jgi:hypothetical protein
MEIHYLKCFFNVITIIKIENLGSILFELLTFALVAWSLVLLILVSQATGITSESLWHLALNFLILIHF